MTTTIDVRTSSAIATRSEAAHLADIPPQRLSAWARPTRRGQVPLVHTIKSRSRFTVPLVGIAEASALNGLREGGMSMQQARTAAEFIRRELGDEYAIASPRLVTDGIDAFIQDDKGTMRLRDRQQAIQEVLQRHLRPLILADDGIVEAFHVEQFGDTHVTVDPRYNAGRMSFTRTRVPVFVVAGSLRAGEKLDAVAADYGLTREEVDQVDQLLDWLDKVT